MFKVNQHKNHLENLRKNDKFKEEFNLQRISERIKEEKDEKKIGGFSVLNKMNEMLKKFEEMEDENGVKKYKLSDQQREFWDAFIITSLQVIFDKQSLMKNMETLKKLYNFDDFYQICLILAPRKIGKTFFSNLFIIILAYCMPEVIIALFSTGKRVSSASLGLCHQFAEEISKIVGEDIILKFTQSERLIIRNCWGGESVINAYPENARGVRGVTCHIAFVDEFAFIHPDFSENVIVPLLTKCPMLTITTRNEKEGNFVSMMTEASKRAERPFLMLIAKKLVCDQCVEQGVIGQCDHVLSILPDWQNPQRIGQIQAILSKKSNTFRRETLGVEGRDSEKVFEQNHIDALKKYNRIVMKTSPSYILLAVDPACGGVGSKFGVISTFVQDGNLIVIFLIKYFFTINNIIAPSS